MNEDFLGRGWAFPVDVDAAGDVRTVAGADTVEDSIRVIVGTAKGERVMHPDFGCGIHEYVFETVDANTLTLVETSVEEALVEFEPRIAVEDVTVSTDELSEGVLRIEIDYRIRDSNTRRNLVYPFYVEGGP
ncbi:GPW/gp25 family protein [Salinigranum sp. GCM10025319]|uniref:GPW/gp25 family protein n=1 Tax=Salinigranum sp. GCM10025319 TaxID=3252687 RepID=UPI00361F74C0